MRQERLHLARQRTKIAKQKHENKIWDQTLQRGIELLPQQEQRSEEQRTIKEELLELKSAKENLWKLRSKENKLVETEHVKEIRKLDRKTEHVLNLLEKEKKRLMEREKNLRTSIKNKENKIKKQELIAEVWATYRWVTEFLTTTTEQWEAKKQQRQSEETTRLENWEQQTRSEKIKTVKEHKNHQKKQQQELHRKITTEILEEIIGRIAKRTEETTEKIKTGMVDKNDGNNQKQQNNVVAPAKFKPSPEIEVENKKKQQSITSFFQHANPNTTTNKMKEQKKQQNNKTQITSKKITTKKNNEIKQQQEKKIKEKQRGYWTQLAIKHKKQQEENKTKNVVQETTTDVKSEGNNKHSDNPNNQPVNNFEASPNHKYSSDDVTGGAILEHSKSSTSRESDLIRSSNANPTQITRKSPNKTRTRLK